MDRKNVFSNGGGIEHRQLLMHDADTLPLCVERACDVDLRSIEQDLPAVRRINAGNDLHQCGFSGAVFADQRMNAAAAKLELHAVQCLDARKGLCDLF